MLVPTFRRLLAPAVALLLLAGVAEAAGPAETWYAAAFTTGDSIPVSRSMWSKGRKFRDQTVVAGVPAVTIVNGDTYYAYDALHGVGVAIKRSPKAIQQDAAGGRPFLNEIERITAEKAEKVRTEKVAGRACDVWQVTSKDGKREAWLTQDKLQLPVKIDVYMRATATTQTTYIDWQRDLDIPDAFFEPDPRVQFERLEYADYVKRSETAPVGPVPVLYGDLLHGK